MRCGAPALAMADDKHVRLHGRQIGDGIEYRLAFALRRHINRKIDDIRRQTLGGNLESRAGARRWLEKKIENCLAAQQRHFLHFALGNTDKRFGGVQNLTQQVRGQAFNRQQMMELAILVELRVTGEKHAPRSG